MFIVNKEMVDLIDIVQREWNSQRKSSVYDYQYLYRRFIMGKCMPYGLDNVDECAETDENYNIECSSMKMLFLIIGKRCQRYSGHKLKNCRTLFFKSTRQLEKQKQFKKSGERFRVIYLQFILALSNWLFKTSGSLEK